MGKKKFCGVIIAYGDVPFIGKTIESFDGLPVYVFNTTKSWWSDEMVDKTAERIAPYKNAHLVQAELRDQRHALNFAKLHTKHLGYDVMIILDSDEELQDVKKLMDYINTHQMDAYACPVIEYDEKFEPLLQRKHAPIVAVNCADPLHNFYDKRCYNGEWMTVVQDVKVNHYSMANTVDNQFKNSEGYGEPMFNPAKEYE